MTCTGGRERRPPAHTAAKTGTVLADLELATILAQEPHLGARLNRLFPCAAHLCNAEQLDMRDRSDLGRSARSRSRRRGTASPPWSGRRLRV